MKVKPDPMIQWMSGKLPGSNFVAVHPTNKKITNMRQHVIPNAPTIQSNFAEKSVILASIWNNSDSAFVTDLKTFAGLYNSRYSSETEYDQYAYSFFVSAIHALAADQGLDISPTGDIQDLTTYATAASTYLTVKSLYEADFLPGTYDVADIDPLTNTIDGSV